jgi:ABC-type uncharacterized transport system substrate-binding protein/serine/threonine protein kinase
MSSDGQKGQAVPPGEPLVGADEGVTTGLRVQGRYRIISELGSSAFGSVWLAEDGVTAQRVAIRFLPRGLAVVPSVARVVQSRARSLIAGSMAHPGLVRVLEVGEIEPGQLFAVMELVEGRRLSAMLSGTKPLDVGSARRLAMDLGGCLESLHNSGLVHGALRPRNVMVLADGRVKLMDVELAGLRDAPALDSVLAARPPAEYLAPEQIRGARMTEKTDIYAFAVLLCEMFYGRPPFEAATREAVLAKHLTELPTLLRRRSADLASVERIVTQALAKEPELRPWMPEILNGLWVEASGPATRWKRPAAIGGGAALVAAITVLVAWGLLGPRPSVVSPLAQSVPPPAAQQAPVKPNLIPSPPASAPVTVTRTSPAVAPVTPAVVPLPAARPIPPPVVQQAPVKPSLAPSPPASAPVTVTRTPPAVAPVTPAVVPLPAARPIPPPASPPPARPLAQTAPPIAAEQAPVRTPPKPNAAAAETRAEPAGRLATPAMPPGAASEASRATSPSVPVPPPSRAAAVVSRSVEPVATAAADAQMRRKTYRVGWLDSGRVIAPYRELVIQALVGYPRDVAFEYRSADGRADRLQDLAAELVQLRVDIVFAVGNQAIQAARQATSTIPIVMVGSDAVTADAVARRGESGGNVTGVTYSSTELAQSWLKLLKELRPTLSRVAVLYHAGPASRVELTNLQLAAAKTGAKILPYALQEGDALGSLFAGPLAERAEAIIVPGGPETLNHLPRIVDLASRARVPTIYGSSEFVDAGGLLAYGPSLPAMYRRAGAYLGKILIPTHPRDLAVEQPSRFELVISLKTARALGLTLPESMVLRADRVIR